MEKNVIKKYGKSALICGCRNWNNVEVISLILDGLSQQGYKTIIEGEAPGADRMAEKLAREKGFKVIGYPAEWKLYGLRAGPIRNSKMIKANPDIVIAFHNNIESSRGTKNMILQAKNKGIKVLIIKEIK
jgi:hypothetical protein